MPDSVDTTITRPNRSRVVTTVALLMQALLAGCGGGGSGSGNGDAPTISDVDPAVEQVSENSPVGAPVGLILSITPAAEVRYSLTNDAGGAFTIDASAGVVRLAGSVDFEASPVRTIVAKAEVGSGSGLRTASRQFQIAVLDSPAPTIDITFPLAHARYSDGTIAVSGVVSHPQPESVRISATAGGAAVQGEIANGTFRVRDVPVTGQGTFTLTVTASHAGGDSTTRQMTISREPELTFVPRMTLDESRARLLLADRYAAAIIASPLDGGPRSIVSGRHVGSGPAFVQPVALSLDTEARFLYVADAELHVLFRVELATGNRTILGGSGPRFSSPIELDFDPVRGNLILSDENTGILTIAPGTGERQLLSPAQAPGPSVYAFRSLGFDLVRDRILVSDGSSLFAVNPATGARTMFSNALSDPTSRFLHGMFIASQAGFAYLADEFTNGIARIDLTNGNRETLTSSGLASFNYPPVGSGPWLEYPEDVVIAATGRVFVIGGEFGVPLMEIMPGGDRVVVRNATLGTGVNFRGPEGLKFDATRRVLVVADNVADLVAEIDVSSGNRTLVTGRSDSRGTIDTDLMDAAYDAKTSQYYFVDFRTHALHAVRPGEAPRVVSDATTGSGPPLRYPSGIEVDASAGIAYVICESDLLAVDLATGARRSVAAGFTSLTGLAADFANQRLYLADLWGTIYSIDTASGAQRLVAPSFGSAGDIAFDSATQNLLVARTYPAQLELIASVTGARTIVAGTANCGPSLTSPRSVAVDSARHIAYVTDDIHDAIIAVDIQTGCRQLTAK